MTVGDRLWWCINLIHDKGVNDMKIIFIMLLISFVWIYQGHAGQVPIGGGPCAYKKYRGRAKIISIKPKHENSGYSHEIFEVKFAFTPDRKVDEPFAQTDGKQFELQLTNSWYPGPRFLKKYGIEVGKEFDCYMKVITRGTCTPVIFEFPSIKLDDYFEG
jgi:hypothetical protein